MTRKKESIALYHKYFIEFKCVKEKVTSELPLNDFDFNELNWKYLKPHQLNEMIYNEMFLINYPDKSKNIKSHLKFIEEFFKYFNYKIYSFQFM